MTQLFFYKSFLFMTELLSVETLFLIKMKRREKFILRCILGIIICYTLSFLFPTYNNGPLYMCFMFISLFAITVCVAKFIFKESWFRLLFCCVSGYTVQHLAYQLNNIVTLAMTNGRNIDTMGVYGTSLSPIFSNPFFTIIYFFIYILTYAGSYYIFAKRIDSENFVLPNIFCLCLVLGILVVDVVLNALALNYIKENIGLIIVGIHNVICCLFGLFLQYQVLLSWALQSRLQMEKIARRFERERYVAVKESMDTINIKCHDLKYREWQEKANQNKREKIDSETDSAISEYGRFTYTGSTALDIVLSEINRQCIKYHIRTSYMTDGKLILFMKDEDIYSLFGNLLNNAVEALSECLEERRVMGIRLEKRYNNLISIIIYNYCGKENYVFNEELPKTTKKHSELHGFGLKSVQRICDKYNGTLDIYLENGFFNVNIIFPIKNNE